jgi:hypothetical protein
MQQLVSDYIPNDLIVDWVYLEQRAKEGLKNPPG